MARDNSKSLCIHLSLAMRRECTCAQRDSIWRCVLCTETETRQRAIISLFFPHNMSADNNYIFILRGRRKVFFGVDQMRRKQALGPDRVTINWLLILHLMRPNAWLGSVSPAHAQFYPRNILFINVSIQTREEEGNLSFFLMACAFYLNINEGQVAVWEFIKEKAPRVMTFVCWRRWLLFLYGNHSIYTAAVIKIIGSRLNYWDESLISDGAWA